VWSPDSRQIAFVRIPPDTSGIDFKPRRSAQPWSIRVADVKTGEGHEVWRAHDGPGSVFHGTETEQQLFWSADNRIVFPWESSGWVHLYSVEARGGAAYQIRDGDQLEINIWRDPELSKSLQVRSDGKISLPLISDVQAARRTPLQLEQDITQKLRSFLSEPVVTVRKINPTELTPGDFEVDYVAFGEDRKTLVYSSNRSTSDPLDADRRHLWEVAADGSSPHALTHGDGLEMIPAIGPDGTVAVLRSDVHVPIRPAVVGAGGELKDLAPQLVPADFPGAKLITPQQVIFSAADGMKIHGQLFVPASAEDGKRHPALVFFHGGSRRQMLLGWHYMDYYSNAYGMNQYLASLGYVVLSVNYRSGIGYGLNFREALNYGAAGASEFNDVQGAGLYLRSRADVDGAKIGVWGGSYGGYLTALALSRASDMFAAGVDFHGVHDWNLELENWQPKYNPDSDQTAARVAWESSPLSTVKGWRSPVLLIQGDDDRNVQFSQTVRLAAALRAQGTPFEEHVFPDEIHGFLLERSWITAYGLTADFFNRKLKGQ
jgi:dipeptidyl aminopeptidase/acylaminoacyl peptidase